MTVNATSYVTTSYGDDAARTSARRPISGREVNTCPVETENPGEGNRFVGGADPICVESSLLEREIIQLK